MTVRYIYEIRRSYDNRSLDYPVDDELVAVVWATPDEMKELEEKASWTDAPYGNEYMIYSCTQAEIGTYNRDQYVDEFIHSSSNHCGQCGHFVQGKCEIFDRTNKDQSGFIACEKWIQKGESR